ncbi:MAG: hypothetical protein AAFR75_11695, partial [Pseudomonadota bacterium]
MPNSSHHLAHHLRVFLLGGTSVCALSTIGSAPVHAACTVGAGGVIECSGTFTGPGISESSPAGINLVADPTTNVSTTGNKAYGIQVESIGPRGGDGSDGNLNPAHKPSDGHPGVPSGNVTVRSSATISTGGNTSDPSVGVGAIGIFGLARAGDGGEGGSGGCCHSGRAGGPGGDNSSRTVSIESDGSITTAGNSAIGIAGQNHGGIGGEGGGGGWFNGGGGGGGGG